MVSKADVQFRALGFGFGVLEFRALGVGSWKVLGLGMSESKEKA